MDRLYNIETNKKRIILFIVFLFVGYITYGLLIVNELPNPDAIWNSTVYKDSWSWEISLGRYMLGVFQCIFGGVVNPPSYTMLSVCILAILCVAVIDIFELDPIAGVCGGLLILLTPAITGTLSYYYCSLFYCFAYLMGVSAAWIICKKRGAIAIVVSALLICFSLATYQAYICCTIVIVMLYLLVIVAKEKSSFKEVFYKAIQIAVSLLLGVVFYLFSNKIVQGVCNILPEEGRGFSKMGKISTTQLPKMIKDCYRYTYEYFMTADMINNFDGVLCNRRIHYVFIAITVVILFSVIWRMKVLWNKIATVVLITLLPVGIMFITMVAPEISIYDTTGMIMLPTVNYLYLLPIILLSNCKENGKILIGIKWVMIVCTGVLIIKLFNFSSAMQTYQKVCINKMNYVAGEIAEEIEKYRGSDKEYEVCIIGRMEDGNYPETYPELAEKIEWTTASYGTVWTDYRGAQASWRYYIRTYFGFRYHYCDYETYKKIVATEEFQNAQLFPESGSVYIYDDSVIVIKLSTL